MVARRLRRKTVRSKRRRHLMHKEVVKRKKKKSRLKKYPLKRKFNLLKRYGD